MAERVVDHLEVVEIEEENRDRVRVPARPGQRLVEAVVEEEPVGESRQWVVQRLVGEERLGLLALRDVANVDDHTTDHGIVDEVRVHELEPVPRASGVAGAELGGRVEAGGGEHAGEVGGHSGNVVGMDEVEARLAHEVGGVVPHHVGDRGADVLDPRVLVDQHDEVVCMLHQRPEPLLGRAERRFREPPIGHIVGKNEPRVTARERERVPPRLDLDEAAIALAMAPYVPAVGNLAGGREAGVERGHVLGGTDVLDGHAEELLARVAVVRDGGLVHGQERQRLTVEDPQRLRVGLEEQPVGALRLEERVLALEHGALGLPETIGNPRHRLADNDADGHGERGRPQRDSRAVVLDEDGREVGHGEQRGKPEAGARRVPEPDPGEHDHEEEAVAEAVGVGEVVVDTDERERERHEPESGRPAPAVPRELPDDGTDHGRDRPGDREAQPVGAPHRREERPNERDQPAAQDIERGSNASEDAWRKRFVDRERLGAIRAGVEHPA